MYSIYTHIHIYIYIYTSSADRSSSDLNRRKLLGQGSPQIVRPQIYKCVYIYIYREREMLHIYIYILIIITDYLGRDSIHHTWMQNQ